MIAFDFNSTRGRPWRVKLLLPGDAYGREDCLTADRPLVEFWDRKRAGEPYRLQAEQDALGKCWPDDGQFVSRYRLDTLLERTPGLGLDLMGYEPAWKISAADVQAVDAWLRAQLVELVSVPEPAFELTTVDGDVIRVTLADFIADNPDLDAGEIRALQPGEALTGGGGAAPSWSIRRVPR